MTEDGWRGLRRLRQSRREAKQLARVRQVAEEDTTRLGEDIVELNLDVGNPQLDDATRADYEQALDSYESAKTLLATARRPADLRGVTMSLEQGRYAMTCVRARLGGEPVPQRRAPCFFNPQHGPSVTDMQWTPEGGVPRDVPVCADDAARLAERDRPGIRYVIVHGKARPYWEAGPEHSYWVDGYYGAAAGPVLLAGTTLGESYAPEYPAAPGAGAGLGGPGGGIGGDAGGAGDAGGGADGGGDGGA